MNKTCAVIVTFNRKELLEKAVKALRNQSVKCDILVVNNGSTDGTKEWLNSQKDLQIIHQENVGGAGGFHTGMKYVTEKGYDFCWVMDDDVFPYEDALETLQEAYNEISLTGKVGFLCSTVLDTNGEVANIPKVDTKRGNNGYPFWNSDLEKGRVKVSTATFVSVFVSTAVIEELGLPYKEYFIWGDDSEYTARISKKYPSYLIGKSKVTHFRVGGAIDITKLEDKKRIEMYRYSVRNNLHNTLLGYGDSQERLISYLWYPSLVMRLLGKGKFSKAFVVIKGIWQGLRFKPEVIYPKRNTER